MKVSVCCFALLLSGSVVCAQGGRRPALPDSSAAPFRPDMLADSRMPSLSTPPDVPTISVPGSSVSVAQLQIPPKAMRELQQASKDYSRRNLRGSADHLEKALRIYPQFPEGHNTLGMQYVKLQELDKALAEFRTAASLNPRYVAPVNNESAILLAMGRLPQAESAARHALDLDPQHRPTRYLLGRILAAEEQNTTETVELLRQSCTDFPAARLTLALVLIKRGQNEEAASALRGYLEDPNASERDKVERALAQLTPNASTSSATPTPARP